MKRPGRFAMCGDSCGRWPNVLLTTRPVGGGKDGTDWCCDQCVKRRAFGLKSRGVYVIGEETIDPPFPWDVVFVVIFVLGLSLAGLIPLLVN